MGLIGQPVAILDIANAEAFVQRTIDASGIQYSPHEREELLAEGLAILFELARKYNPGCGGRDASNSRFSGYAAMFLPRRLGDAWHRWHPEHRYVTDPTTGKRGWRYDRPTISLDGLAERDEEDNADHQLHRARTITAFVHTATVALLGRTSPLAA
jgi:hypothetical protein